MNETSSSLPPSSAQPGVSKRPGALSNGSLAAQNGAWRSPVRDAPARSAQPYRLARALGWLSLAIGVTELLAPRTVARAVGSAPHPLMTRATGLRELAAGVMLLQGARPQPGLWMRVAGDAMDLASVAGLAHSRQRAGWTLGVLGAITLIDLACVAALEHERHALDQRPDWDYADRGGLRRVA